MTTNQTIDGVPRAYADLERINIHGEADRKGEDGAWIKTWKERQPGKTISHHSRASGLWNKISARCLAGGRYQRGNAAYIGTTNGFDDFQQFAEWCNHQPGYSSSDAEGFRFEIDKDILVPGNKVYSPDTCCFVPKRINSLLTSSTAARGEYPIGVSYVKRRGVFVASCKYGGKMKHLGHHASAAQAHAAWQAMKVAIITDAAMDYRAMDGSSVRVYEALMWRAARIDQDRKSGTETLQP